MSDENDITFQQILQIALGGDSLDTIQISLLHTVIDLVLKKLDCENDKVTITGQPAEDIEKLLQESNNEPGLAVKYADMKFIVTDLNKITEIEAKLDKIEAELAQHLDEVNAHQNDQKPENWISMLNYLPCEIAETKDETISQLSKNEFFARELKYHLSTPIIRRLNNFDFKLQKFSQDFVGFKKDCADAHAKINKIDDLAIAMPVFRDSIKNQCIGYGNAMKVIQHALEFKVDNCDTFPIKSDFKNEYNQVMENVQNLVSKKVKPRALIWYCDPLREQGDSAHFNKCYEKHEKDIKQDKYETETETKTEKETETERKFDCSCDPFESIYLPILETIHRLSLNSYNP